MAIVMPLSGASFSSCSLPALPKPSLLATTPIFVMPFSFIVLKIQLRRVAVLLRRLEDVLGDRVDDRLGRGAGDQDRLVFLADVLDLPWSRRWSRGR